MVYTGRCLNKERHLTMRKYIYLAGPIAGCTENEATEWRDEVA